MSILANPLLQQAPSRCNLNCSYCYMYNLADKSYLRQPAVMTPTVVDALLARVRAHAIKHGLCAVSFIFHGGEPLLAGKEFFRSFVETAKSLLGPTIKPRFSMQTNATMLSSAWLDLLETLGVRFGISLDGTAAIHDTNRVDHQGRGSYDRVADAVRLIVSNERYRKLLRSALTVIDLRADPVAVYRHLRGLGLPGVDFLLPNGTLDFPPPGIAVGNDSAPYADWLIAIFDEWFDGADGSFKIRIFQNIIGLIFGSEITTSDIGGRRNNYLVVETDGGIEPLDSLKACGEDFTKMGLNVLTDEIDEVYQFELFRQFFSGAEALCRSCRSCPIVSVCGGGYLPHRYRQANGFDNPSVYCRDLAKLISHIQARTLAALPDSMRSQLGLATLSELQNRPLVV